MKISELSLPPLPPLARHNIEESIGDLRSLEARRPLEPHEQAALDIFKRVLDKIPTVPIRLPIEGAMYRCQQCGNHNHVIAPGHGSLEWFTTIGTYCRCARWKAIGTTIHHRVVPPPLDHTLESTARYF